MVFHIVTTTTNSADVIFVIGSLILLIFLVDKVFTTRKTKQYREEVGDLYVAGKIRNIAIEDSVDIYSEYGNFKAWLKKQKIKESTNYDDAVESEMIERVEDSLNKKEKKK